MQLHTIVYNYTTGDSFKICALLFFIGPVISSQKAIWLFFSLGKSVLAVSSHLPVIRVPGNGFQEDLLHNLPWD